MKAYVGCGNNKCAQNLGGGMSWKAAICNTDKTMIGDSRGTQVRGMGPSKAAPWLKRLVAGFPPLRSGVRDRVCHVGFCGG
jgi:hypothetical protein